LVAGQVTRHAEGVVMTLIVVTSLVASRHHAVFHRRRSDHDPTDLKLLLRFLDIKGSPKPTTQQFNWVLSAAVRGCTSICSYPLELRSCC
jgi:hypothetical protein